MHILEQDRLTFKQTKTDYLAEAAAHMNAATKTGETTGPTEILSFLTRGVHQLASRQLDEAAASFDGVLSKSSHNTVALLGKVRDGTTFLTNVNCFTNHVPFGQG